MRIKILISVITALLSLEAFGRDVSLVQSCDQLTRSAPGFGVSYKGQVINSDYRMSVLLPKGKVGWSGVAQDAPFHGFVIFPDHSGLSCIILNIGWRVDDDEKPVRPINAKVEYIDGAVAWSEVRKGDANGLTIINKIVSFSAPAQTSFADGQLIFVSVASDSNKNRKMFDDIVRSLKFENISSNSKVIK